MNPEHKSSSTATTELSSIQSTWKDTANFGKISPGWRKKYITIKKLVIGPNRFFGSETGIRYFMLTHCHIIDAYFDGFWTRTPGQNIKDTIRICIANTHYSACSMTPFPSARAGRFGEGSGTIVHHMNAHCMRSYLRWFYNPRKFAQSGAVALLHINTCINTATTGVAERASNEHACELVCGT